MTSSSDRKGLGHRPVRPPTLMAVAVVAVAAVLMAGACRAQPVDETAVDFTRAFQDAMRPGADCADVGGRANGEMDAYLVQAYQVLDATKVGGMRQDCLNCIANPSLCQPLAPICVCGGPTLAAPGELEGQLKGTRLESLDSGFFYCLRVLAIDRGTIAPARPTECECDPEWSTAAFQMTSVRLCAASARGRVGPPMVRYQMEVRCPGDMMDRGGSPFQECLFPKAGP